MREFPSCFGENGVQVADSSSSSSASNKNAQNTVTCIYHTHLAGRSCKVTVTWNRSLIGQGFSIGIDDLANQNLCKVDIKSWFFSKRKGSKTIEVYNNKVDVFWNLSAAKYGPGPEPLEGFYVSMVADLEMVLLLGDMSREAYKKTSASPPSSTVTLISKKEHIFGKRMYCTRSKFRDNGQVHEVSIDCETLGLKEPCLEIHIDRKRVMQVKRLAWKFRGNQTIVVDGIPIEVFWDVHSWLFGTPVGNAVFVFQTCLSAEKLLLLSSSRTFREAAEVEDLGFSLVLHAWKVE